MLEYDDSLFWIGVYTVAFGGGMIVMSLLIALFRHG